MGWTTRVRGGRHCHPKEKQRVKKTCLSPIMTPRKGKSEKPTVKSVGTMIHDEDKIDSKDNTDLSPWLPVQIKTMQQTRKYLKTMNNKIMKTILSHPFKIYMMHVLVKKVQATRTMALQVLWQLSQILTKIIIQQLMQNLEVIQI